MTMRNASFALVLVLATAGFASAAVMDVSFNSRPEAAVPDHVVNDVLIDFDGNLRGQQMILNLTAGSVFQHSAGGNTPPNPAFFPVFADIEFDTFVAVGGATSTTTEPILEVGGAVDLQPGAATKFDGEGLNFAWAPGTGVDVPSGTDYMTARITLSNDAAGSFRYFGSTSAGTGAPLIMEFDVADGIIGGGAPPNEPPVGVDALIDDVLAGGVITHQFQANDPDNTAAELTWSALDFSGVAGFDGTGIPNNAPTLSSTGEFEWDTLGSARGVYTASATVTDPGGETGTAVLTINITAVPEPSTVALVGLAIVGLVGLVRRHS